MQVQWVSIEVQEVGLAVIAATELVGAEMGKLVSATCLRFLHRELHSHRDHQHVCFSSCSFKKDHNVRTSVAGNGLKCY